MATLFEGSYLGDDTKLGDDARLECGICWWVYDPAVGDDVWQIPAGTAFSKLHADWRCPVCDADKTKFMVLDPGGAAAADAARVEAATEAYRRAEAAMRGLPVHNPALKVEAVGFRRDGEDLVGVIVTPWCMNLTVLPGPARMPARQGHTIEHAFPSGRYPFIGGSLEGFGAIETCSLFSPMSEFDDPAVARSTAEAAIEGLYQPDEAEARAAPPPPAPPPPTDRRGFLTGRRA